MGMVVAGKLSVCGTCLQIIANGEATYLDDGGEAHAQKMSEHCGPFLPHVVLGGDDLGFCKTPCHTCGDPLAGDRYEAVQLLPMGKGDV